MSEPFAPPPGPPTPEAGPVAAPPPVVDWQRLDTRMLLVHPVSELIKFLPVLIGLFVASTATYRARCSSCWRSRSRS